MVPSTLTGGAVIRTTRSEHLFVVRIWQEHEAAGKGRWRGSVDHVTSGQKHYFGTTGDLVEFMMRRLEERSAQE